eukprot:TRINITY_DN4939_c0_g1_i1.p1 TRINITY_DN4939_c0_g1~~TRINITY_DN4939_c0_g1_i1.p1  ORF type:complete len:190 (+),score=43.82 TRINITY_DN4939_c0_g1_i1:100-669(+)
MDLFVSLPGRENIVVTVGERTTVGELKEDVAKESGLEKGTFDLVILGEKVMNESVEVSGLGVVDGDVVEASVSEWWPVKGYQTKYKIAKFGDDTQPPVARNDIIAIDVTGILASTRHQIWSTMGLTHTVDAAMSILGFDKGCLGMFPGEVRCLLIPPEEGYIHGYKSLNIPPNTELIFEIRYHKTIGTR